MEEMWDCTARDTAHHSKLTALRLADIEIRLNRPAVAFESCHGHVLHHDRSLVRFGWIDVVRGVDTGAARRWAGDTLPLFPVVGEADYFGILEDDAVVLNSVPDANFVVGKERVLDGQETCKMRFPSGFSVAFIDSNVVEYGWCGGEITLLVCRYQVCTGRYGRCSKFETEKKG